jgi:dipeptidyl aminopeptidase/acylaminoacyl peptidase
MGWSYGGYMTCWIVTHTDRFKAAITGAPVVNRHSFVGTTDIPWFMEWHGGGNPWEPEGAEHQLERSSIRYVDRVVTPTMVVCGEGDLRCPIEQADQFYMALKRIGKAPAVQIRYPGEFHGLQKPAHKYDRYERTLAWFNYYLKG